MARVALATQAIVEPSLSPQFTPGTDVTTTFLVSPDADYVEVVNANAGTIVVTVETGGTLGGFAVTDKTVSIPTTQRRKIPLKDKRTYLRPTGGADGGMIYVGLDIVASVTAGAFKN